MELPEVVVGELSTGVVPYKRVEIYPRLLLGAGSYGVVCRAKCDDLPCAAKMIHTYFLSDPGIETLLGKFTEECETLRALTHPNIVQFLCVAHIPVLGGNLKAPVQLTEVMEESLRELISRSRDTSPLPYYQEVNIMTDIALALSYLHNCNIIHRDLSSNNVLLLAGGQRAKVTDFGMAKLRDLQSQFRTPVAMTSTPGAPVFMPPEARFQPIRYDAKMDVFSWGVICISLLSLCEPNPGPELVEIENTSQFQRVPEQERRIEDINKIPNDHPLCPIALSCIADSPIDRPTSSILCSLLENLSSEENYKNSREKVLKERESLRKQLTQQEQLTRQLQDELAQMKLQQQNNHQQEEQSVGINDPMAALKRDNERLLKEIVKKEAKIKSLIEQINRKENTSNGSSFPRKIGPFKWSSFGRPPCYFSGGSATSIGSKAYFSRAFSGVVHVFDCNNSSWSTLTECPKEEFTLAAINGKVLAVGGVVREVGKTKSVAEKSVLCLDLSRGPDANWEHYLPMFYSRILPAVVSNDSLLVVAGGWDGLKGKPMDAVEIFDTVSKQWYTAYRLPRPITQPSMAVNGSQLYVLEHDANNCKVYHYSLNNLFQSSSRIIAPTSVWSTWQHHSSPANITFPKLLTISNKLEIIGQATQGSKSWQVYQYQSGGFSSISDIPSNEAVTCHVAVASVNKLVVITMTTTLTAELYN